MPTTLSSLPVDQLLIVIAVLVAGLLVGVVVAWLVASRSRTEALEQAALRFEVTRAQLTERAGAADPEREATTGKLAEVERAREHLSQAFSALSADALKSNNQAFIDLAQATFGKL